MCIRDRPEAAPGAPYERVILYLSPDYLARAGTADCPLDSCFALATARFRFVLRPQEGRQDVYKRQMQHNIRISCIMCR